MLSPMRHGIRVAGHKTADILDPNTLLSYRMATVATAGFAQLAMSRMHPRPLPCPDVLIIRTIGDL